MKKTGTIFLLCIVLVGVFAILTYLEPTTSSEKKEESKKTANDSDYKYTVIVDAGHGGIDPGKIGVNGVYEMDINLSIAYKLSDILEEKGIKVVMTRKDDNGLYNDEDSNKKMQDMENRVRIINESDAKAVISIHQNSFTEESAHGAQVFYHNLSAKGELLAGCIQNELYKIDDTNSRKINSDADYYILRKSNPVAVIVECGFLSNNKEAELLSDGAYQEKIAKAIAEGVEEYVRQEE